MNFILDPSPEKIFNECFPVEYLPAKKRKKIESSKETKPPAAETSDQYLKWVEEKEREKNLREKRLNHKKQLMREKN